MEHYLADYFKNLLYFIVLFIFSQTWYLREPKCLATSIRAPEIICGPGEDCQVLKKNTPKDYPNQLLNPCVEWYHHKRHLKRAGIRKEHLLPYCLLVILKKNHRLINNLGQFTKLDFHNLNYFKLCLPSETGHLECSSPVPLFWLCCRGIKSHRSFLLSAD